MQNKNPQNPNDSMTDKTSPKSTGQNQTMGRESTQGVGSPITNEAYNVISALHAKLEGLEAYRKYSKDAGGNEMWKALTQLDVQAVTKLVDELERVVRDGKLRVGEPGRGNA